MCKDGQGNLKLWNRNFEKSLTMQGELSSKEKIKMEHLEQLKERMW